MTDIILGISGATAVITLNRPEKLNALTGTMLAGLRMTLDRVSSDRNVRAVVLTGAGRAFFAGGDVQDGRRFHDCSHEEAIARLRTDAEIVHIIYTMPKPTIAVLRGAVAGAGIGLALACDFRIGGTTTKFVPAYAKLALSGDFGGSYLLSQIVGAAKAKEIYFLSTPIDASEALQLGLLTRIFDEASFEESSKDFIQRLAAGPTAAFAYMKENFAASRSGELAYILDVETRNHINCHLTQDYAHASVAFTEKRPAVFTGR